MWSFNKSLLVFSSIIIGLFSFPDLSFGQSPQDECVILLHGLGRTKRSMSKMEMQLRETGYSVVNWDYPSRKFSVEQLAAGQIPKAIKICEQQDITRINFVTHSLGGILLRYYLQQNDLSNLGRVVMLSPPNGGSEIVDRFRDSFPFQFFFGPAGSQLGTASDSFIHQLSPADFNLGIIMGNKSYNPFFSKIIPGADDGIVSIDSGKIHGMKDFLIINAAHSFIMRNEVAITQTIYFLRYGKFNRHK